MRKPKVPREAIRLFALSWTALFLELMVIRWVPAVVRLVAYYTNLMLISSFLGLGVGLLLTRRGLRLFRFFPLALAIFVAVLLACRYFILPGSALEFRYFAEAPGLANYLPLVLIFLANAATFVPLGEEIGRQFERLPNLRAYAWDLGGSLCGTLGFAVFSFAFFSPQLGMAAVMGLGLLLAPARHRLWSLAVFGTTLGLMVLATDRPAFWSPYHYITVHRHFASPPVAEAPPGLRLMKDPPAYTVKVNQDFYQYHGTLDLHRYSANSPELGIIHLVRVPALLPYRLSSRPRRVVVVGAGGGKEVEAALLSGATEVDAVEIDPVLVRLSSRFSAAAPYDDPRVQLRVEDARAFLHTAEPGYDHVVYGFLDSQALFSSMSSIRLDGYVYTVEGFRDAYRLLAENGTLSVAFAVGEEVWLAYKLKQMLEAATGAAPVTYTDGDRFLMIVRRGAVPNPPPAFDGWVRAQLSRIPVPPATDDWPYLYLMRRVIPADYLIVMAVLLALSLPAISWLRPRGFGAEDGHFLFMGVGFLLLETKSIVDSSLYFGATWLVTTVVIAGVLLMVLLANLLAESVRFSPWLYLPLLAALAALYFVPRETILGLDAGGRTAWTLLVVPLPIFFAGLIFSTTFRDAARPSAVLGANLLGAMLGGFAEYLSMATGLRTLSLVVIAAYLLSWLSTSRMSRLAAPTR